MIFHNFDHISILQVELLESPLCSKLRKSLKCISKLKQITELFQLWQMGDTNPPQKYDENCEKSFHNSQTLQGCHYTRLDMNESSLKGPSRY